MSKQTYEVTYRKRRDRWILSATIRATDYWDACTKALKAMPKGANDFDVTGPDDVHNYEAVFGLAPLKERHPL
jgi:hypothetical protein